ncbi:galactan-beta-galactosidase [Apiospora hydei]|uniref:Galactan-beta-galactosidase n=1 Tax=Apiospora hydei TaxID=1337664 RepID=A0ABR1V5D5_9PEZI
MATTMRLTFARLIVLCCWAVLATAKYIVPGARWHDTDGNLISAHAGSVSFDDATGKFWWFGEYKVESQTEGGGVSVYSSEDLATWAYHGLALEPIEDHPYISPDMIIQRPKVVYSGGQYHMWWHADNSSYGLLLQGLATSPSVGGPYTFANATSPLGNWSQDFGLFTDYKDGRSYALYSNGDRREARDVYIAAYDEGVSALEGVVHRFDKYDLEAPCIVQTESSYYALMSHKTGYRPNSKFPLCRNASNFSARTESCIRNGRRSSFTECRGVPCRFAGRPLVATLDRGALNTRGFNSQSGYTLTIRGTKKTTYLYLGDQWDSNSLWESRYIWLPMRIDDEKKDLQIEWHDVYDLDVKTGDWKPVKGETYFGKNATTKGNAFKQEANFASDGIILTGIYGNDSTVTFSGIKGTGKPQWVSFYYQNTDDMGFGDQPGGSPDRIKGAWQLRRISSVVVNGDEANVQTLFQRDTHKGIILSTPLLLTLKKGSSNTITVGGLSNGVDYKGADLDRIIVYPPEL